MSSLDGLGLKKDGVSMYKDEFTHCRKKLAKTQKNLSELLCTSLKAVHSYEQGWRSVPAHVERQMYFLVSRMRSNKNVAKQCWVIKKCPPVKKKQCPAWEFQVGHLCWFINGTICHGEVKENWEKKMKMCRKCEVFLPIFTENL